jgi:Tfp pilus assembly protein PilO
MRSMEIEKAPSTEITNELYLKNRSQFLRASKITVGIMLLLAVMALVVWWFQKRTFEDQKAQLEAEHEAIQKKHEELEQQKAVQ